MPNCYQHVFFYYYRHVVIKKNKGWGLASTPDFVICSTQGDGKNEHLESLGLFIFFLLLEPFFGGKEEEQIFSQPHAVP